MKNWQHAEQIISSGESVLISVLKSHTDEYGVYLPISQIELMVCGYIPFENKAVPEKFKKIVIEIANDMKQAKQYLGFNTNVEDALQELNK